MIEVKTIPAVSLKNKVINFIYQAAIIIIILAIIGVNIYNSTLPEKIEKLEERNYNLEVIIDAKNEQISALISENKELKSKLSPAVLKSLKQYKLKTSTTEVIKREEAFSLEMEDMFNKFKTKKEEDRIKKLEKKRGAI